MLRNATLILHTCSLPTSYKALGNTTLEPSPVNLITDYQARTVIIGDRVSTEDNVTGFVRPSVLLFLLKRQTTDF